MRRVDSPCVICKKAQLIDKVLTGKVGIERQQIPLVNISCLAFALFELTPDKAAYVLDCVLLALR